MYEKGDRVEVVHLDDHYAPIPFGTRGTVDYANYVELGASDRFWQVGVKWDNGRSLMACIPPDVLRKV